MTPLEQRGIVGTCVTPEEAAILSDEERWELLLRALDAGLREGRVLYLKGMDVIVVDASPNGETLHRVTNPEARAGLARRAFSP